MISWMSCVMYCHVILLTCFSCSYICINGIVQDSLDRFARNPSRFFCHLWQDSLSPLTSRTTFDKLKNGRYNGILEMATAKTLVERGRPQTFFKRIIWQNLVRIGEKQFTYAEYKKNSPVYFSEVIVAVNWIFLRITSLHKRLTHRLYIHPI